MIGTQNYLSVGRLGADPMNPEWLMGDHALPSRADAMAVTMYDSEKGYVFASLHDRLCIYKIDGLTAPVRLLTTKPVLTIGRVMFVVHAPNGNLVCAMGEGGVAVFAPTGETLGQIIPAGVYAPYWPRSRLVWVGDTCVPNEDHPFYGQKRLFRCTQTGTTAAAEPWWTPAGTVVDGSARWVDAGPVTPVVNGITLDHRRKRIYVVSTLGGPAGTGGRLHVINAQGLI